MDDTSIETSPATHHGLAPVLIRLHHEWRRLRISAADLDSVRRWGLPGGPIDTLDDVLARSGYVVDTRSRAGMTGRGTEHDEALFDDYLIRLLRIAPSDALAARIVLQRILPPLCAVARRHTLSSTQRHDMMDDLVANSWPIICRYPTERRPRRVASNLVRDIAFETVVRPTRRRCAQEIPTEHADLGDRAAVDSREPLEELVELLREAATVSGVQPGDIEFIAQLISNRPEQVAAALDVTTRTVRNRRNAVVHRLRTLVACAA
jgi:hypothetical protein